VSLFFRGREQKRFYDPSAILPNSQVGRYGSTTAPVTSDTALRVSACWAALRLRANLISTMPVDAYRMVGDVQVEVKRPTTVFVNGGREIEWHEFLYCTQMDLDRSGNTFGVITQVNALGLPARIELVGLGDVSLQPRQSFDPLRPELTYRVGGVEYEPEQIWHERQYTVAGLAVGLSPVAYAAYALGAYASAQDFAIKWFGQDAIPAAVLKNNERVIPPEVAAAAKAQYAASMTPGGIFVTGADWSLEPMNAANESNNYLGQMAAGVPEVARFFDVPADMIDGAVAGSSITYANLTQRNLQLLIMSLGPAIARREKALSKLVPGSRFVKLNTDALLRMDPLTKAQVFKTEIDSRTRTPDEARALNNLAPLSQADKDQFTELFPGKTGALPGEQVDEQPTEVTSDPATP
jgi:HK97 family phage portal protein